MAKIVLKDKDGTEFDIEIGQIQEIHRYGEQSSIVDKDGNETILTNTVEEILNKVLYAKFGEA